MGGTGFDRTLCIVQVYCTPLYNILQTCINCTLLVQCNVLRCTIVQFNETVLTVHFSSVLDSTTLYYVNFTLLQCNVLYSAVQYLFYEAVLALHFCSVMYCTPLYNICFIKLYQLYTFVVQSTVLLYCIVCTLLWCSTPLYTFQDLNLIFCTHLVYACAPCVWWLFTVTCAVFVLCVSSQRGRGHSWPGLDFYIGQLTEVWRLRSVLLPSDPLFHLCVCAPRIEGPLARGG